MYAMLHIILVGRCQPKTTTMTMTMANGDAVAVAARDTEFSP